MNSSIIPHSWLYVSLFSLLFLKIVFSSSSSPSLSTPTSYTDLKYNKHCSSFVPEYHPTSRVFKNYVPYLRTSYFAGGESLLSNKPSNHSFVRKVLRFRLNQNLYETAHKNIYKVDGYLTIRYAHQYSGGSNSSSYYNGGSSSSWGSISFQLHGFWSELSRKLCMIGSASQRSPKGYKSFNLDVVLKLHLENENPTMFTSVITGALESTDPANDSKYFDPISIFSFPQVNNYDYSLVSEEIGGGLNGDFNVPKNESLVLEPSSFCTSISVGYTTTFELEYATECKKSTHCSPLDGFSPQFVNLYAIQCSIDERKMRYMVTFQNGSYYSPLNTDFDLNLTFVAEGSWDDKYNQILVIACRLQNPANYSRNAMGDCGLRLSLRYPSIWTIKSNDQIVGQIWTNKSVNESGYFKRIKLTSFGTANVMVDSEGIRYAYTELDRVRKLCVAKKPLKKNKDMFPDVHSYDMRFDMSVKSSNGKQFAWGFAQPLFVENELFEKKYSFAMMAPESSPIITSIPEPYTSFNTTVNISYKMSISPFENTEFWTLFPVLNSSLNHHGQVEINAEGIYNSETGQLCMVGCRKVTNGSFDCEILVNIDFAPVNERRGGLIKGTIISTRKKSDPLRFEELSMTSVSFYQNVAKRSIWRMDLEITMVLISNTLICIFLGLQIFHVKRNPVVLSGISVLMLMILTLGLVIPLVVNFEALFSDGHDKQRLWLSSGGWVEANEVAVRVVTMVAFLLQIRLFQLVWIANISWVEERKAFLVSLVMYTLGGLVTLLLNWIKNIYGRQRYFLWGDLRSYLGLILDGFLLPQIVLNAFRGSVGNVLSCPFYVGTSVVRVVPHAYDQYRAWNYPAFHVNGTYYYADHGSDFYSTAWDAIIPCGVVALALVVFFQQRRGGRCILPHRFRELELYEKVVVVDNE